MSIELHVTLLPSYIKALKKLQATPLNGLYAFRQCYQKFYKRSSLKSIQKKVLQKLNSVKNHEMCFKF